MTDEEKQAIERVRDFIAIEDDRAVVAVCTEGSDYVILHRDDLRTALSLAERAEMWADVAGEKAAALHDATERATRAESDLAAAREALDVLEDDFPPDMLVTCEGCEKRLHMETAIADDECVYLCARCAVPDVAREAREALAAATHPTIVEVLKCAEWMAHYIERNGAPETHAECPDLLADNTPRMLCLSVAAHTAAGRPGLPTESAAEAEPCPTCDGDEWLDEWGGNTRRCPRCNPEPTPQEDAPAAEVRWVCGSCGTRVVTDPDESPQTCGACDRIEWHRLAPDAPVAAPTTDTESGVVLVDVADGGRLETYLERIAVTLEAVAEHDRRSK